MCHRIFSLILCIVISLLVSSCGTMMVLLGDNIRFSISGNVQNDKDGMNISNTIVSLDCEGIEKSLYQDRTGKTDLEGNYILTGYWELKQCRMLFEQDAYELISVTIDKSHLASSKGLSRTYNLDVQMKVKETK